MLSGLVVEITKGYEGQLRKKLEELLKRLLDNLPPNFPARVANASKKSGSPPETVIDKGLQLFEAGLMPKGKEQLRIYASQYHSLVGKEIADNMPPEQREERARLGGYAAADSLTENERKERAGAGGRAAASKMTEEAKRRRALAGAEARRKKREAKERSGGSPKRSR